MQITTDRINTLLRWCEYTYVVVLLFALTQGPVYSMWHASSLAVPTEAPSAQLLTFVAVQIPALLLLGYRRLPQSSIFGPVGLLGLFCGWMLISTLWATLGQHTIAESTTLCITFLTGVYLARSFSLLEQLTLVVVAMQPGLLLSRYAIANNWSNSVDQNGNWVGIYFNRNSLAPVAMISCLAATALLWIVVMRRGKTWPNTLIAVLIDVILLGVLILIRAGSKTSIGGAVAFVSVWAFWTIVRSLSRQNKLAQPRVKTLIYPIFIIGVSLLSYVTVRAQNTVLGIFGEVSEFNGRSAMWRYSWTGFLDRPLIGWGWLSAWRTPPFMHRDLWWSFVDTGWSHSGIMDVLLGGGIIGGGLFVGALIWGTFRHMDHVTTIPASQWTPAIMFFVLGATTQESFIIGNHFLWMLFVAAVSASAYDNKLTENELTS